MKPTTQVELRRRLQEVTLEEGEKLVVNYLQEQASAVLGLVPPRPPEPQRSLNELGFDSVMAMELRHRILTELEADVPPQEFVGASTLAQLARTLRDQLVLASVVQREPPSPDPGEDTEEITL